MGIFSDMPIPERSFEDNLKLLQSSDTNHQLVALTDLQYHIMPETLQILVTTLDRNSISSEIIERTLYIIGIVASHLSATTNIQIGLEAICKYIDNDDVELRCRSINALKYCGDYTVVHKLIERLSDKNSIVRSCAAEALGAIKSLQAIPYLLENLNHHDTMVRINTIDALVECALSDSSKVLSNLIGMLKDENMYVRKTAVEALGRLGDPQAFDALWDYISTEQELKPSQGAWAVAMLGTDIFERLVEKLSDRQSTVRYWATVALGQLGDQRAIVHLESLIHDEGQNRTGAYVSTAAKKAISKLQPSDR